MQGKMKLILIPFLILYFAAPACGLAQGPQQQETQRKITFHYDVTNQEGRGVPVFGLHIEFDQPIRLVDTETNYGTFREWDGSGTNTVNIYQDEDSQGLWKTGYVVVVVQGHGPRRPWVTRWYWTLRPRPDAPKEEFLGPWPQVGTVHEADPRT